MSTEYAISRWPDVASGAPRTGPSGAVQARGVWETLRMWHDRMVSRASHYDEDPLSQLPEGYGIRRPEPVRAFIGERRDLLSVLTQAAPAIESYFPDASLFLDAYPDPEEPSFVLLALRISTHVRYPETRKRLKRFLREWWYSHTDADLTANVVVDTEST